jgi:RNA polymerase sigma factor (sigma-70 family)
MPEFEAVLRAHSGLIHRISQSYERDPHRSEDLAQEIALALWRALASFRGECSVRTFVGRVAHNRAMSHAARESARPRLAPLDPQMPEGGATLEQRVEALSDRERLMEAVRSLPLSSRQTVTLWLEGFSMAEIGDALGISAGNAAVRMARARERLRATLEAKESASNA